jgi:hypothetical protein
MVLDEREIMLHETEGIRVETISNVSRIREEEEM